MLNYASHLLPDFSGLLLSHFNIKHILSKPHSLKSFFVINFSEPFYLFNACLEISGAFADFWGKDKASHYFSWNPLGGVIIFQTYT